MALSVKDAIEQRKQLKEQAQNRLSYEQKAAESFIDLLLIKNINGTLFFLKEDENPEIIKWVPDEVGRDESTSTLLSTIFPLITPEQLGLKLNAAITVTHAKKVYQAIKVMMANRNEQFIIAEGEENSSFFTNGVLKPTGFVPYQEPSFKLFTLNLQYNPDLLTPIGENDSQELKDKKTKYNKIKKRVQELFDLIFPNPEIQKFAKAIYYTCLIPKCFELLVYNVGDGSNGKSYLMEIIASIVGREYVGNIKPKDSSAEDNFILSDFKDKLMVINQEGDKSWLKVSLLKEATTNGSISIEKKGKDRILAQNYSTLIVNSNYNPNYSDTSKGMLRRIILIPFEAADVKTNPKSFNERETLLAKTDEMYQLAFINLMHEAFIELYQNNEIQKPEIIQQKINELHEDNNPVLAWFKDFNLSKKIEDAKKLIELEPLKQGFYIVSQMELFKNYQAWRQNRDGATTKIGSQVAFVNDLRNVLSQFATDFLSREVALYVMIDSYDSHGRVSGQEDSKRKHFIFTLADDESREKLENFNITSLIPPKKKTKTILPELNDDLPTENPKTEAEPFVLNDIKSDDDKEGEDK